MISPPRMTKEDVVDVFRRAEALGDCVPEDVEGAAAQVAEWIGRDRVLRLLEQLRDGVCVEPEAATSEIVSWLHEEQARTRASAAVVMGLPVKSAVDVSSCHIVVEWDPRPGDR